jgi:serine-type D-Ala-D-Ala carboxypeptidase (penicillin-binding protein 5/6)
MDHTTYTDPSGFAASTVSTAADQLRVFQQAMRFPVFGQIVSIGSVTLPVGGHRDQLRSADRREVRGQDRV